jgi:hypothetical protein
MTQKNKLIIGAVVLLGAYYLYNKNKVKNELEDLKEGADYPAPPPPLAVTNMENKLKSRGEIKEFKGDVLKLR